MIDLPVRPNLPRYLATAEPRLVAKLIPGPLPSAHLGLVGPCLHWTASTNRSGYGQISVLGGTSLVHRVAYELYVGDIPAGHNIHHRCERILCCNPHHFELIPEGQHIASHNRKRRTGKVLHTRMERQSNGEHYKLTILSTVKPSRNRNDRKPLTRRGMLGGGES